MALNKGEPTLSGNISLDFNSGLLLNSDWSENTHVKSNLEIVTAKDCVLHAKHLDKAKMTQKSKSVKNNKQNGELEI